MAPVGAEHQRPDGNQHDITRIRGDVGHDPQKNYHGANQGARGHLRGLFEQRGDKAASLRHPDAQHRHKNGAERCIAGEVAHRVGQYIGKTVAVKQADRPEGLQLDFSGFAVDHLAGSGNTERGAKSGKQNDGERKQRKQSDGMRQAVAHRLHTVEETPKKSGLFGTTRSLHGKPLLTADQLGVCPVRNSVPALQAPIRKWADGKF